MKFKVNEILRTPYFLPCLIFGVSFICGMLPVFLLKNRIGGAEEWLESIILYLKYGEIYYNELLFYILKKRLGLILLIVLVCYTRKPVELLLTGIGMIGVTSGFIITEWVVAKGIMGSFLFAISVLPHYLCYMYGYFKLINYIKGKSFTRNNINQTSQCLKQIYLEISQIIVVVIIGMLLECYVNPSLLKIFLNFFM